MSKCEHNFVTCRHGVFTCGDCNQELAAFPGDQESLIQNAVMKAIEEHQERMLSAGHRYQREFNFDYMNAEDRI